MHAEKGKKPGRVGDHEEVRLWLIFVLLAGTALLFRAQWESVVMLGVALLTRCKRSDSNPTKPCKQNVYCQGLNGAHH